MKESDSNKSTTLNTAFMKTSVKVLKLEHTVHAKSKMSKAETCLTSLLSRVKFALKTVQYSYIQGVVMARLRMRNKCEAVLFN